VLGNAKISLKVTLQIQETWGEKYGVYFTEYGTLPARNRTVRAHIAAIRGFRVTEAEE